MKSYIFFILLTVLAPVCTDACSVESALADMSHTERVEFKNKLSIAYSFYKSDIGTDDEQVDDIFNYLHEHGVQTSKIAWHPSILDIWLKKIEQLEKETTK